MTRNITPLNDVTPAPEAIPDRSDLSKLYERQGTEATGRKNTHVPKLERVNADVRKMSLSASVTVNLLVAIPYVLSFISITAIYSLGEASDINRALENRIATILLTIPALLPWVFSIRILRNHLSNYRISSFGLVVLYSLFIFPILDISMTLHEHGVPDGIFLMATFVLSQIYIWFTAYVLNSDGPLLSHRVLPAGLLVFVLVVSAVLL